MIGYGEKHQNNDQNWFVKILAFWPLGWLFVFTLIAFTFSWWPQATDGTFIQPEIAYLPPFQEKNYLFGTDQLGRNLLFYLLQACQTAWLLTFPPLILSTGAGMIMGFSAGYYGNSGLRVSRWTLVFSALILAGSLIFYPIYYWRVSFYFVPAGFESGFKIVLYVVFWVLVFFGLRFLGRKISSKKVSLPLDLWLTKAVETWSTLPKLLLLLLLSALTSPNLFVLMGWIAVSFWVLPARLTQSKVRELKSKPFLEAAVAMGLPTRTILVKYILPSLKGPLLINFCFAASGLLGIGASLAYLGIGLPPEDPSWGKMLANARFSVTAWWLLLFPSLFLLLSIFSLQTLGHKLSLKRR